MLNNEDWDESPLFNTRCISIWDQWLFETDAPNALSDATIEQKIDWQNHFNQFHIQVIEKFNVYIDTRRKGIFKEIVNNEKAVKKLSGYIFIFLIPEIRVIYQVTYDFTGYIYFQDFYLAKELFETVKSSGLNFLNEDAIAVCENIVR